MGQLLTRAWVWWSAGFIYFPYGFLPVMLIIAIVYPSHFIEHAGQWYVKSDWLWATYPAAHRIDWIYTACQGFMLICGMWFLTACAYQEKLMKHREEYLAKQNAPGTTESASPTQ